MENYRNSLRVLDLMLLWTQNWPFVNYAQCSASFVNHDHVTVITFLTGYTGSDQNGQNESIDHRRLKNSRISSGRNERWPSVHSGVSLGPNITATYLYIRILGVRTSSGNFPHHLAMVTLPHSAPRRRPDGSQQDSVTNKQGKMAEKWEPSQLTQPSLAWSNSF